MTHTSSRRADFRAIWLLRRGFHALSRDWRATRRENRAAPSAIDAAAPSRRRPLGGHAAAPRAAAPSAIAPAAPPSPLAFALRWSPDRRLS
jgi:hypothetical protein